MAKRAGLLALALVFLTAQAACAQAPRGLVRLDRAWNYLLERQLVGSVLEEFCAGKPNKKLLAMGSWTLHAEGFAFRVPDGMERSGRLRGMDILLADTRKEPVPFRTIITVSVSPGEDSTLRDTTEEGINSRYRGRFTRFTLLDFERDDTLGEDGIRITFLCDNTIKTLVQQHMFNKNGSSYVLTLSMENTFAQTTIGFAQYEAFRESMLFVKP